MSYAWIFETTSDILFAELTAIHHGLLLPIESGIDEMVCYSYSMLSIKFLNEHASIYHVYTILTQDIKDLFSTSNFSVYHCLREGNQCADFLAKLGATSNEEFSTHDTPPSDLLPVIKNDIQTKHAHVKYNSDDMIQTYYRFSFFFTVRLVIIYIWGISGENSNFTW